MASSTDASDPRVDARRRRTVVWVVGLATLGLIFDGYDLVVYGAVVPTFLRDPSQIGHVSPAMAGALGSYALVGVLVGALLAGAVGDIIGRRKVMLAAYAWFAIGMGVTALTSTVSMFGLLRFLTGLGVGALVATTGALVAEYAPPGKKNLANCHHLLRRAGGKPAGRPARHPAARPDRVAWHVLDRGVAARHPLAAGDLQDARVGGLAGRNRSP